MVQIERWIKSWKLPSSVGTIELCVQLKLWPMQLIGAPVGGFWGLKWEWREFCVCVCVNGGGGGSAGQRDNLWIRESLDTKCSLSTLPSKSGVHSQRQSSELFCVYTARPLSLTQTHTCTRTRTRSYSYKCQYVFAVVMLKVSHSTVSLQWCSLNCECRRKNTKCCIPTFSFQVPVC